MTWLLFIAVRRRRRTAGRSRRSRCPGRSRPRRRRSCRRSRTSSASRRRPRSSTYRSSLTGTNSTPLATDGAPHVMASERLRPHGIGAGRAGPSRAARTCCPADRSTPRRSTCRRTRRSSARRRWPGCATRSGSRGSTAMLPVARSSAQNAEPLSPAATTALPPTVGQDRVRAEVGVRAERARRAATRCRSGAPASSTCPCRSRDRSRGSSPSSRPRRCSCCRWPRRPCCRRASIATGRPHHRAVLAGSSGTVQYVQAFVAGLGVERLDAAARRPA